MATSDAMPVPRKGAAYRAYAPVFDADGDLVSGITGQDTEVSKDGGAFADCTNEFVEIGTSGIGYIDLTSTEMNADAVVVRVQVTNSGAKTTPIFLYPQEAGDIPVTVEAMNAGTVTASAIATGAIDADAIAADAITDAKVASDVTIASVTGAVGSVTGNVGGNVVGSVGSVAGAVGSVTGNVGGNVVGSVGSVTGAVGSVATGGITAASIAADAIGASELAADAVAEIQSGLATASALTTAQTDLTTLTGRLTAARAGYLDNLSAGAVATASALSAVATSVGLTATAAKLLKYVQLLARKDAAIATDNATELTAINANGGSGAGAYANTTDSQEAIRDAISAGSASAADIAAELGGMGYTVVDADSVTATAISKRRGDVWTITLTDLGSLGTWTKLWFTIKTGDTGDADTDAKVQVLLTNPTAGTDGLQRLNGAAATAAQGGIVVDDSATGDITVTVASAATTQLAVRSDYVFDVQILRAAGTTTLAYGTFTVRSDVTRAVS